MLQFRLLGQFEVCSDSTPIPIPSRPAQSLLAYLLLTHNTSHRREKLAGLFWPDTSETNARRRLRQELWRLRKAFEIPSPSHPDLFLSDDLCIGIDPQAAYYLDVAVLDAPLPATPPAADLICALEVYHGELLPDFYDEWAALERERLRARFEQRAAQLLEQLCVEQRWTDLLLWAERWIALGRSPEPAFRALMVAHNALGNRAQVGTVFKRCATALREDLGVEPSEQTRALYDHLLHDADAPRPAVVSPPQSTLPTFIVAEETAPESAVPPYKGLQYFDEADAEWFFGREQLVATLVNHLDEHHLLTVVGASGSGKSSLVRAGLIPALKAAPPDGNGAWAVRVMTPTAHPLEMLAVSLTRGAPSLLPTANLLDDLARDPRALRLFCEHQAPAGKHLLLVIDQFEELFTLCREDQERRTFIDNLLRATAPELDQPLHVVVAVRADFYAHCAQYGSLREALSQRQEYIGPMTPAELQRAIEGPAQRAECELEPGLVELMLRDVGDEPGALPLLSHALLETWKQRRENVLTLAGYASCGGVRGAIAQTAETVFHALPPASQEIARHIFMQLTELGEGTQDTRRRVKRDELVPASGDADSTHQVLNQLAQVRLVTLGEDSVEVAHEALIREWPALREWLNQNREGLRLHRQLAEAAQGWDKLNHDAGALYRGVRLSQTLEWLKGHTQELTPSESEFLAAAVAAQEQEAAEREAQRQRELQAAHNLAEEERKRAQAEAERAQAETSRAEEQARANSNLRQRALYLAGALLVAGLLAVAALVLAQQSNQNAARAEAEQRTAFVRELSVNAVDSLNVDPERSILLALQAVTISTAGGRPVMQEAEDALHRAVASSRVLLTLRGHTNGLRDMTYSPDGKRVVTVSDDKTAKVWDAASGQELLTLCCHDAALRSVAYSPDGTWIATGATDGTVKVWDAVTGQELLSWRGHSGHVWRMAVGPDGKRLATAGLDKTAKVWDVATGQELLTLVGHTGGVGGIAYSPDGTRIATGGWTDEDNHTVRLWDAATGQLLLTMTGHTNAIWDAAFSPDGKRFITSSGDTTAKVWDIASGQPVLTLFVHNTVMSVAYSPDGTHLATGDSTGITKVWDAATGDLLVSLPGHNGLVVGVAFSPDGTQLTTASGDATARVWDITPAGNREWLTIRVPGSIYKAAYSPDGTRIATAGEDKRVRIWDAKSGRQLLSIPGHTNQIMYLAYSPQGDRLATAGLDQTVRVWDAVTGQQLVTIPAPSFVSVLGPQVAFSPDGRRIVSADAGGSARIWDAATGQELVTLCCHTASPGYVRGVAFSPDGQRVATGAFDGSVKVWDAASGQELLTLPGHAATVWGVVYSPDGRQLATASNDGTARVWDAATGKQLWTLSSHSGLYDLAYSADGTRLATVSGDGTVKVWDLSTSAESEPPLTLYTYALGVSFSPDGKRLVTAGYGDNAVRVYALPLEDIVSLAKARVTRGLTADECQEFLHVEQCPP